MLDDAILCHAQRNGGADVVTRVHRKEADLILKRRHRLVFPAALVRNEVLRAAREVRLEVALADVREDYRPMAYLIKETERVLDYTDK